MYGCNHHAHASSYTAVWPFEVSLCRRHPGPAMGRSIYWRQARTSPSAIFLLLFLSFLRGRDQSAVIERKTLISRPGFYGYIVVFFFFGWAGGRGGGWNGVKMGRVDVMTWKMSRSDESSWLVAEIQYLIRMVGTNRTASRTENVLMMIL